MSMSFTTALVSVSLASVASISSATWSADKGGLLLNGKQVVVHGIGTTCTEYMLSGVGVPCVCAYNWNDREKHLITAVDTNVSSAIAGYLSPSVDGVVPAIRLPMTAADWVGEGVGAPLTDQFQQLIQGVVEWYTNRSIVVILDLHWNDQSSKQQPMALKGNSVKFWDSVSKMFGSNPWVWFELYNEPHIDSYDTYANGDATYAGMLEMYSAVRKNTENSVVVIAGALDYAYDEDSLIRLDKENTLHNVVFNFHPYMGYAQEFDYAKTAANFSAKVTKLQQQSDKPLIITEFGQYCCPADGACYLYPGQWDGQKIGFVEAIMQIAEKARMGWLGWAWRPQATAGQCSQPDMNGDNGDSMKLIHSSSQQAGGGGADWADLFPKYYNRTASTSGADYVLEFV